MESGDSISSISEPLCAKKENPPVQLCQSHLPEISKHTTALSAGSRQGGRRGIELLSNIIQLHSVRNVRCSSLCIYLSLCCGHLILVQEAESHIEEMEMEMVSSTSPPEKTALKPTAPSNHQLIVPVASNRGNNSTLQAPLSSPGKVEKNGHAKESHHTARVFEIHSLPNGKTRNLLKAVIRRKLSQQKEKKATQMLAIVLGESVPWLPQAPCRNPVAGAG